VIDMPNKPLYFAEDPLEPRPRRTDMTDLQAAVYREIKRLPERYAAIMLLVVYGENGQKLTLTEIGQRFAIGDERVRQLRDEAYGILRQRPEVQLIDAEQRLKPAYLDRHQRFVPPKCN
jgi:DNA-directed RNA polymerase sigma subunit (sigma70/sigma32)